MVPGLCQFLTIPAYAGRANRTEPLLLMGDCSEDRYMSAACWNLSAANYAQPCTTCDADSFKFSAISNHANRQIFAGWFRQRNHWLRRREATNPLCSCGSEKEIPCSFPVPRTRLAYF